MATPAMVRQKPLGKAALRCDDRCRLSGKVSGCRRFRLVGSGTGRSGYPYKTATITSMKISAGCHGCCFPAERMVGVSRAESYATSEEWTYRPGSILNEVM